MATSEAFCRTVASSIFVFCSAPSAPSLLSVENPSVSFAVSSLSLMAALDWDAALLTSYATCETCSDAFLGFLNHGRDLLDDCTQFIDVSSMTLSICDASRSWSRGRCDGRQLGNVAAHKGRRRPLLEVV